MSLLTMSFECDEGDHAGCPGGEHQPGSIGGWDCSCACHLGEFDHLGRFVGVGENHSETEPPTDRVRWFHSFDWSNRCTLQFDLSWYDNDHAGIALTYGLRGCDPVWMVSAEVNRPPRWLAWIIDKKEGVRG